MGITFEGLLHRMGITPESLEKARQRKIEHGGYLRESLIALGELTPEEFAKRVLQLLRVPYINVHDRIIPEEVLQLLPRENAEKYLALPVELDQKHRRLTIAMADPSDMQAIDELKFVAGYTLIPQYTPEDELQEKIRLEYSRFEDQQIVATAWANQDELSPETPQRVIELTSLINSNTDVSRLIGEFFAVAHAQGASDLHIIPDADSGSLGLTVEGKFFETVRFPKKILHLLISRMKRLLNVEIGEQSHLYSKGYTALKFQNNKELDLSYLFYPTIHGEAILFKLKDRFAVPTPQNLDIEPKVFIRLQEVLRSSYGAVLVTGTARSGLTTTLYTFLNTLNKPHARILSVENPIECQLAGVAQGQISPESGQTYVQYAQYILRQRPDVVMIDHIFEPKMAQMLLQIASGSLVLSSLTAVDTASAAMKLNIMSHPRLVADRVSCITSQRLVRKICESCREKVPLTGAYRDKLGLSAEEECYVGKGCEQCGQTGYKGFTPIFEVMPFESDIQQAVIEARTLKDLRNLLVEKKIFSLRDDGMKKVKQGLTTVQEVLKATML